MERGFEHEAAGTQVVSAADLRRPARALMLANVVANLIGLASGIALARALGPDDRGEYQVAVLCYGLLPVVLGLGLSTLTANSDPALPRPLHSVLRVCLLLSAGGALASAVLGASFHLRLCALATLTIGALGFMSLDVYHGIFRRHRRYEQLVWMRLIDGGGTSVGIVLLFASGFLSVEGATIFLVFPALALVALLARDVERLAASEEVRPRASGELRATYGANVLRTTGMYSDQIAVLVVLSHRELGIYALAFALAHQLMVIPAGIIALGPEAARRDTADGGIRVQRAVRWTVALGIASSVACLLFGRWFFATIFGDGFTEAGVVASVLLFGVALQGASSILEVAVQANGAPHYAIRARVLGHMFGIAPLLFFLVSPTVQAATLISLGISSATFCILALHYSGLSRRPVWQMLNPLPDKVAFRTLLKLARR